MLTNIPSIIKADPADKFHISVQTDLSVGPLSLRVDSAVALCVLASWLRLWRVPLERTAKLETLVLCWHGDAEPWEALGVQVGLHARCHAVGALKTSPPATQGVTVGPEPSSHMEHYMQKLFSNHNFPPIIARYSREQSRCHWSHYCSCGCDKPC